MRKAQFFLFILYQLNKNREMSGSGILRSDFEIEEDYNAGTNSYRTNYSMAMIGVVLAAVSVAGAVHSALTLSYTEIACKFTMYY